MADKFVSEQNLKFLFYDVFDGEALLELPLFAEHSREMFDMILQTALKLGKGLLRSCLVEMDRVPPRLENGAVIVHPLVKDILREFGEGGWISATAPVEAGGQGLPHSVNLLSAFVFAAANYSASAYPMLTTEAALLIHSFGSDELRSLYIPPMFAGRWQGTMALTEPQAGSSLSDIATSAEPTDQGYYRIRGQKIFISGSEHDGVENVVQLLLARVKGAPAGVKGISLFVVPNRRPDGSGGLVPNDVNVSGVYHKLGYRGCPITQLSLGEENDCRGWLIGEAGKGLGYMFQMMNAARIGVGAGAAAIASAAYYASLEYARERPQGRRVTEKDPLKPQIPIIEHADVKRMLLFQRAVVEGSLSLLLQCSLYYDLSHALSGEEARRCATLLELLTPVAKSYPSEMGVLSVSQGLQILGGYGYCDEFPLEQYYRDVRIHPIHEGTTGIHGITMLGRNVGMMGGRAYALFLDEVGKAVKAASAHEGLAPLASALSAALDRLTAVTSHLAGVAGEQGPDVFLSDATLYLELFGIVTIAWQWLKQACAAQAASGKNPSEESERFLQGKLCTARYFFEYELPKIEGLCTRLMKADGMCARMSPELFAD